MRSFSFAAVFLASLSAALPQSPGDPDFYNTVADIYSGPSCSADSFVWADPIFGTGGTCQLLDRNNNTPDIYSYKVTAQYPGCTGKTGFQYHIIDLKALMRNCTATLYSDDTCSGAGVVAAVGQCVEPTDGKPFVRAFVDCGF